MAAVAVEVRRPSALRISDDAVRQAARRSRKRGLSGTRHHGRAGRHAPRRPRQADRPGGRFANRRLSPFPPTPKRSPGAPRAAPKAAPESSRLASVFRLGLAALIRLPVKGMMRRRRGDPRGSEGRLPPRTSKSAPENFWKVRAVAQNRFSVYSTMQALFRRREGDA